MRGIVEAKAVKVKPNILGQGKAGAKKDSKTEEKISKESLKAETLEPMMETAINI